MKFFLSIHLIALLLICRSLPAIAVPAYPGLIKMEQPDGSTISIYLKGDEKVHWMESEDGYSLLYDNNRTIVYAISDETGNMIPSPVVARDISFRSVSDQIFLKKIPKKLSYSTAQINTLRSIWNITQDYSNTGSSQLRASVGDARAICALVDFPDKQFVKTKEEFNNLMNQAGYSVSGSKGSVNDYFKENSYGKLNLIITVAGPYTLSKNWQYYGENGEDNHDIPGRVQEFAMEAARLTFTDKTINPADYDNDNDGFIDGFHIIYAGFGEEAGGGSNPDCIWAHAYSFSTITFGNKKLNVYSCSPELRGVSGNNITHIGVICHEMCHVFGSPDFYDTVDKGIGKNFNGTGKWDIMAEGSWNSDGACPAHINMYQKIQYGWVTPVVLTQPQIISSMANSAQNPVAYRYDTSTPREYYILENRQKKGFDQSIPGNGLLIYHVSVTDADIRNNNVNSRHPQKVYPVCASASSNPTGTPSSYGNINSSGCPFPGSSGNKSFTDYTIPSATAWNGSNTVKPITEISVQNEIVSFRFLMPDAEPVINCQAIVENQNTVKISWNKPSEDVTGYNIYRNNLLLIKLIGKNNTSYTQYNVIAGNHNYCVTALYNNKESAPVCKEVKINNSSIDSNAPVVQKLNARNINGDKDIELRWQSPFVNDWMTHAGTLNGWCFYATSSNQFVSVARFSTDDLLKFHGSKLTKVRFSIYNTNCKHTLQVWIKDPLASVPGDPIINQPVINPSNPNNNFEITLNSPVILTSDKELWIGIKYELNPLQVVAGYDAGPMLQNRNFIFMDNKWYNVSAKDDFNWFISGYLQFDDNFLKASESDWLRSSNALATNYVIYRNNQKIATTTQPVYVDLKPAFGNHIYCVSIAYDNGKESESVCVEATSTNNTSLVTVNNKDEEINIYPNPVKKGENLTILFDSQTVSTFSLYTTSGILIHQESINQPVYHKKMDFEPGIYLINIVNNEKTFTQRIIIR